jgi:hypothetical protein
MGRVLRRLTRAAFWTGLMLVPFLGAAAIVGAALVGVHVLDVARSALPLALVPLGLLSWMGLVLAYRTLLPVPCERCGRGARATSLNPITIRCRRCGHVEELQVRVLGAP